MKRILFSVVFLLSRMVYSAAQNPGEIIFSKTSIDPMQPETSVRNFEAGDAVYAVAYLPKTIQAMYNAQSNAKLDVEVFIYEIKPPLYDYQQPSEEQLTFANMRVSGEILKNKYLVIEIAPDPAQTKAYSTPGITFKEFGKKFDGPVNFTESLSKIEAGKHNFKIVVKCNYSEVASGNLAISGDDFSMYKKRSEELNSVAQNAGAKEAVLPAAKKTDATLQAKMNASFKNSNDWKSGFIDASEVLRISIIDPDWFIRRNELTGAILHRYIRAAIAVKTKNGNCAYYDLVTFQEDYVGGKFQPLKYDGAGDKIMMDCGNVKK
ncbi:MAG: hypothetical protein Q7U54_04035 [Bacteroidales bacterium]|nr:hypothetical protein [Bacteroidales bacterium]